ncbi:endo alpha-1,4 polygalactosaminidase [Dactylosporangium vinaceum]|uniref:Endo alpha-1,4 polygalactosaminidase n=1 Tax=Dactylosporangium vinaceum TaxID=53362 RepID=A0ABV5M392_9ACTN|nr:endo alpha-1,4 polygalactosaminidase [Dactylosporangium vinaceum]
MKRRAAAVAVTAALAVPGCSAPSGPAGSAEGWVYQLQGYDHAGLTALAKAPQRTAVIDLARDAGSGWFRPDEITALRRSGKRVLAYFEIGSIERFRPEYPGLVRDAGDLVLNRWGEWPDEYFVRYWDERWWDRVVRPRLDRALAAGFDGVYLDTLLAYEEVHAGGERERLAAAMVGLLARVARYARDRRPGFWVVPQNSPELRRYPGYTDAIDGIGIEELFYRATDRPCTEEYCTENLADVRALRGAGKVVLAVDYARTAAAVKAACTHYRTEGFIGTVTTRELDRVAAPCG